MAVIGCLPLRSGRSCGRAAAAAAPAFSGPPRGRPPQRSLQRWHQHPFGMQAPWRPRMGPAPAGATTALHPPAEAGPPEDSGRLPPVDGNARARSHLPGHTVADAVWVRASNANMGGSRQAVPGGGDFWGDEKHRGGVGARSALRQLTRRICPSAVSAANAASYAARPRTEHRSGVGAQRRPPQHEPPPGTACRDARKGARPRSAAMGRFPPQRPQQVRPDLTDAHPRH